MKKFLEKKIKVGKKGFTLVELIVVIVIIAILAAIAIPAVSKYIADSKDSRNKANYRMLRSVGMAAAGGVEAQIASGDFGTQFSGLMGTDGGNISVTNATSTGATVTIKGIAGSYEVSYTAASGGNPFSVGVTGPGIN